MRGEMWAIVLAAGAGRRLAGLTGGVPKQFWRPDGGVSLLEATLHRVAPLAPASRTIVIVDESHRPHVRTAGSNGSPRMLYQPLDRGTATGVLMALIPVLVEDPEAVVVLTPSDHGVDDDEQFREGVRRASERADEWNDVVLFGVQPTHAVDDYGWIVPAEGHGEVRAVDTFIEKPPAEVGEHLRTLGAVWNTMVVVSRASALRALYESRLPELAGTFDVAAALPAQERDRYLAEVYPGLPSRDFSRDVLEGARCLQVFMWPRTLGWSDLGTPERFGRWLAVGAS